MRIQVRKCRFTGKVFEESNIDGYVLHLTKLREKMREGRRLANVKASFNNWLSIERAKPITVDGIAQWIINNQHHIMDAFNAIYSGRGAQFDDKFLPGDRLIDLRISTPRFDKNVSNSHQSPDSGITNWCNRNSELPSGYPGWHGRVAFAYKSANNNRTVDWATLINMCGLKTGSGGGGGCNRSYELYLFIDDWPGLQHQKYVEDCDLMTSALKGNFNGNQL